MKHRAYSCMSFSKGTLIARWFSFNYSDNIISLSVNPALLCILTQALCMFLEAKGLVISPKSCTEPSQTVRWIGKKFDLKHTCVENLPSTTLKSVRAAVQPLSLKRIERITGRLQWFFGPRQGATSFLYGWHKTRWQNIRHTHTQAINQTGSQHVRRYCHWCGTPHCPPPPPHAHHFLSVYFFSVYFYACLSGPLGLDNLPPTSPPCPLTA